MDIHMQLFDSCTATRR